MVHVWSNDPAMWRKLARLGVTPMREAGAGKFYALPLAEFRWGRKRHGGRGNLDGLAKARAMRAG